MSTGQAAPAAPTRETVITMLTALGFTQHVSAHRRRRRRNDPDPADGFRVFTEHGGDAVLLAWVPAEGGDHKRPGELAKSLSMAEQYAEVARAAGWRTELGGTIWHHVRILPNTSKTN